MTRIIRKKSMVDYGKADVDLLLATKAIIDRDLALNLVSEDRLRYTIMAAADRKAVALELRTKGLSNRKIAKITGADESTIREDLRNAGNPAVSAGNPALLQDTEWTPDQLVRKAAAEAGDCVVANMREQNGERIDEALLRWAEASNCFVRIDRKTDWGNHFEMPEDGDRVTVVTKFSKFYLPYKDGLLKRIPTLRGKVLGCWCHPEECHGHIIAEIVNREANGDGSAEKLADEIADVDA